MIETYVICMAISLVSIRLSIPLLTFFATKWVEETYGRTTPSHRVNSKLRTLAIILFIISLVPLVNVLTAIGGIISSIGTFLFTNKYSIKVSKFIYALITRLLIGKGRG